MSQEKAIECWVEYSKSPNPVATAHTVVCRSVVRGDNSHNSLSYTNLCDILVDFSGFRLAFHDCVRVKPASMLSCRPELVVKIEEARIISRKSPGRCDGCYQLTIVKYGFRQRGGEEVELCVPCKAARFGDGSGRWGDIFPTAASGGLPSLDKKQ